MSIKRGSVCMKRPARTDAGKWLLLCFPYGLYLMWRKNCRWPVVFKSLVSLAFAALAVTIIAWPSPDRKTGTTVTLVGAEPSAEVFGPELPQDYDASGYLVQSGDDSVIAAASTDETVYVYASSTEGSTYYHLPDCKYAFASSQRMTLYEAYVLGYTTPCSLCNPPIYDAATGGSTENPAAQ